MRLTVTGPRQRLDRWLAAEWPGEPLGRRRLAALLAAGDVRVNGRPARKGTLVLAGDEVTLRLDTVPSDLLRPGTGRLDVIHVDASLVAVDKPPGLPSVGGGRPGPSLAALLLGAFPEMARIDARRAAGLVHRLDTATSGLLIAARTPAVYERLRGDFRHKAVTKDYLAVVHGRLRTPRTVSRPLRRHARSRGRMVLARPEAAHAWSAVTEIVPLRVGSRGTLVHLRMRTGVTHQLRVHLASIGHPIVGDTRYHAPMRDPSPPVGPVWHPAEETARHWHYLHAAALRFDAHDLPEGLETRFPDHWRPLFRELGWPTQLDTLGVRGDAVTG